MEFKEGKIKDFYLLCDPMDECKDTEFWIERDNEDEIHKTNILMEIMNKEFSVKEKINIIRKNNNETTHYKMGRKELIQKVNNFSSTKLTKEEQDKINHIINTPTYNKCSIPGCSEDAIDSHNISESILRNYTQNHEHLINLGNRLSYSTTLDIYYNTYKKNTYKKKYKKLGKHKSSYGYKSGIKKAFCAEHDKGLFRATIDKKETFEVLCSDLLNNTNALNLLLYKSIIFQYISHYDYLWCILWDRFLSKYSKHENIDLYSAWKKLINSVKYNEDDNIPNKDILLNKILKSPIKNTINEILFHNITNNDNICLLKKFFEKENIDIFFTEDINFIEMVKSRNYFDINFLKNNPSITHSVTELPISRLLISGSIYLKDFGFIIFNIYPDVKNKMSKVIISNILDVNTSINKYNDLLTIYHSYDIYDWFKFALNNSFSTIILDANLRPKRELSIFTPDVNIHKILENIRAYNLYGMNINYIKQIKYLEY